MKDNKQHTPLQILLADDDMDDRFFFDKALQEIPIATELVSVYNGEQLMVYLEKNAAHLPDLLFLDLSMPRKTGFECLSEIKENDRFKDIPVVMLTTSFTRGVDLEDNLKNTLSRMGAMNYIRKPGDFEELKQVIQQTIISVLGRA
ncbi:MAG: response regulator [Ferruginibacter sp.]